MFYYVTYRILPSTSLKKDENSWLLFVLFLVFWCVSSATMHLLCHPLPLRIFDSDPSLPSFVQVCTQVEGVWDYAIVTVARIGRASPPPLWQQPGALPLGNN